MFHVDVPNESMKRMKSGMAAADMQGGESEMLFIMFMKLSDLHFWIKILWSREKSMN